MERIARIGDVVMYCLEAGRKAGEFRPAFVVQKFGDTPGSAVNLQVFTDGTNDDLPCPFWATSRLHGPGMSRWLWTDEVPE